MKEGGEGCAQSTKGNAWRNEPCGGDMAAFVMADGGFAKGKGPSESPRRAWD
jgi:hypothetical protein